ncbi:MAG: branched-chain amino acid ABC transporter permease, partial [Acetobacteraceae bacterium]|nr:branched-chain amino acid ABC transporter permease [Acetobacteraceae bacterium]
MPRRNQVLAEWLRQATPVDWFLLALRVLVLAVVGGGMLSGMLHPRYSRSDWFSFLSFGLTIGAIYALIALGYTMVYGILRMVNFAHGDVFMFGGYASCFALVACGRNGLLQPWPWLALLIALAAAIVVSGSLAIMAERIAYRPFRRGRLLAPLISTLGLSFVLEYSARGMFGAQNKSFPTVSVVEGTVSLGGLVMPRSQLVVVTAA